MAKYQIDILPQKGCEEFTQNSHRTHLELLELMRKQEESLLLKGVTNQQFHTSSSHTTKIKAARFAFTIKMIIISMNTSGFYKLCTINSIFSLENTIICS